MLSGSHRSTHTSVAIWHRGRSHRRANRSESPNRRHSRRSILKWEISCTKIHDRADQKLFWRGPKIFGRAHSLVRFPPPYVLHLPISRPNLCVAQADTPSRRDRSFCKFTPTHVTVLALTGSLQHWDGERLRIQL